MVDETTVASREISIATQQQRSASEQVVTAMAQVSDVSRQYAAGSQQAADSADELAGPGRADDPVGQRVLHPLSRPAPGGRVRPYAAGMTGFETLAIHAGQEPDPTTGAVVPPIYQVSTYKQDGVGGLRGGYEYSPVRQPDPHRPGGVPGRARGRGARPGVRLRAGRRGHPAAHRVRARRPRGDPRRRLRRHVPAVRPGRCSGGALDAHPGAGSPTRRRSPRRSARARRRSCGSRRPPTRCWGSPTSPRWPRSRTPPARCWSSTTRSPRRTCSSRWRSAPTSSCTRPRSTSAATAT